MFTVDLDNKFKELNTKIDAIKIVKSVQRGVVTLGTNGSDISVSIKSVDMSKAIILLQGSGYYYSSSNSSYSQMGIYVSSVTDTSFVISQHTSSSSSKSISWQVIEFC